MKQVRRRKVGDLCDPLATGWKRKETEKLQRVFCHRDGNETGMGHGTGGAKWKAKIYISVSLLPWQKWPVGYQGVPSWVGAREEAMSWGREIRRGRSLWSTADGERHQGKLKQVFCCTTGNETEELVLEEQKEKGISVVRRPGSLVRVVDIIF